MITFTCTVCKALLNVDDALAGKRARCPTCMSAQAVPALQAQAAGVSGRAAAVNINDLPPRVTLPPAAFQRAPSGRRYGFNCPYCSSRLEANESLAGTDGQCPTCGSNITIPILDRYGRLIDPKTKQIIKPDPHPVHAYAAAGQRAPKIIRMTDGSQHIQCSKCGAYSSVQTNNCRQCGMPFTMEGTTAEAAGASNGFCVASLVLGIIGIPAYCIGVLSGLAILFGVIGLNQVNASGEGGGKGMAIAGIICGCIGAVLCVLQWT
jgi:DNA-directed RNA polymerase subunit RPC12/RpoP